jgi:hypothetical protein
MGRLYLGLFLRTLAAGLQEKSKFQGLANPLLFANHPSNSSSLLSLPFLTVALVSFFSLVNLGGLWGFPLVDPQ